MMASLFLNSKDPSVMWSGSKMEYETVYGFFLSEMSWQGTDVVLVRKTKKEKRWLLCFWNLNMEI
jgi:hypothetical protein